MQTEDKLYPEDFGNIKMGKNVFTELKRNAKIEFSSAATTIGYEGIWVRLDEMYFAYLRLLLIIQLFILID